VHKRGSEALTFSEIRHQAIFSEGLPANSIIMRQIKNEDESELAQG